MEETKEIALIVAVLSFDIKQILKKRRNNDIRISIKNSLIIACFRSSGTERDCKDNDEMEPLEEEEEEEPVEKVIYPNDAMACLEVVFRCNSIVNVDILFSLAYVFSYVCAKVSTSLTDASGLADSASVLVYRSQSVLLNNLRPVYIEVGEPK